MDNAIPKHIEAEKRVLSVGIADSVALAQIASDLKPEDFYPKAHQVIYLAMLDLWERGDRIDRVTLEAELKKHRRLTEAGGVAYLCELEAFDSTTAGLPHYTEIVRQASMRRQAIRIAEDTIKAAMDDTCVPLDLLATGEASMRAVATRSVKSTAQVIGDIVDEVVENLEANRKQGAVNYIQTGFLDLDRMLHGLHPGDLIILAARPAMGKTAMALNLALDAAQRQKKSVMFFSLEMSKSEVASRAISCLSIAAPEKVNASTFRKITLTDAEMMGVGMMRPVVKGIPLYVDDTGGMPIMELRIRAKQAHLQGRCDMIIVDYLQLVAGNRGSQNREQEVADISRSLKALAKELKVPVIALSQLNRSLEQRGDKRPQMSDLRESGSIEQDADVIIFLYRDEVYNKEKSSKKGLCEVIVGKHRHGPIGDVVLAYNGKHTTFLNYAPEGAY